MGKKAKTGKGRKDKFYKLAKETGYRARSAFKLLQLNRKFQFLQKSRVLIDLCAAPGGWLQVASNHMPVSSLIVGVDLVPIRPIPNTITVQADITTEKCRSLLRNELKDWKADIVLNDGAPNVGKNWLHDAFTQASLTLKALKLASDFLTQGGWFVTKVFRSKDYQPLMWVFKQLFKKVHATKPPASRSESAEIFVVCQGYIAPDKIDAKFFDLRHIFKEVAAEPKKVTVLNPEKKRKKAAEGYDEGDYTLYQTKTVGDYFKTENPLDMLSTVNEVWTFGDDNAIAKHSLTTPFYIKVLGKKDIRSLLNWRKKILKETETPKEEKESESEDLDSEEEIEAQLDKLKQEEKADARRKKKQLLSKRRKLRERLALKMDLPNDTLDFGTDEAMFSLAKIKSKEQLSEVGKGDINFMDEEAEDSEEELQFESASEDESDDGTQNQNDREKDWDDSEDSDDEDDSEDEDEDESENDVEVDKNPLMVDLEDKDTKKERQTKLWFDKDSFAGVELDEDEDIEIAEMTKRYKQKGGVVLDKTTKKDISKNQSSGKKVRFDKTVTLKSDGEEESESLSDDDSDYDDDVLMNGVSSPEGKGQTGNKDSSDFEVVKAKEPAKKSRKLSAEGMALGSLLISSKKNKRNLVEHAFNRYTFNDDHLPDWFVENEARHCKQQTPVTKEMVAEYRMRLKEINARPIKKVAEAKARKKRKMLKKMEKARKKAEVISDTVDMSDREKANHIKSLYKKAGLMDKKKKNVHYVVSKKSLASKKARRPAGVKGPYKVVDKRMKKEVRAKLKKEAKRKKGRSSKK
uniref:Putative rRNA methyltransferase n=1 Tax=Saccoglossus kowalevskii TaxID=10224 RepID=A0ABM0GP32_SACKO|nr:PREDICTED: pre-rRNA processing protein FTSJ3-like [Saccoglossus kowalevskii]